MMLSNSTRRPDLMGTAGTIGRMALASLFILGGFNKIFNFTETVKSMESVGIILPTVLLPMVITLELAGGALIAFALPRYRIAAMALAIFTLMTNYFFHDFWTMQGQIRDLELSLFFKNIAIAGALIVLATADNQQTPKSI